MTFQLEKHSPMTSLPIPHDTKGLTPKQRKFVDEYLIDLNATQAAIRAGYSKKTANRIASENLSKPVIQAAIEARRAELAENTGITPEKVIAELAAIGFSNIIDIIEAGDDFASLSREQQVAVSEVTVEHCPTGKAHGAAQVKKRRIKMHDKRAALVALGKHLGLFEERRVHEHAVKGRVDVNTRQTVNDTLDEIFGFPSD